MLAAMTRNKKKSKTPRSVRNRQLSFIAKEAKIQKRTDSVTFCLDKFDREIKKQQTAERKDMQQNDHSAK